MHAEGGGGGGGGGLHSFVIKKEILGFLMAFVYSL